MLPEVIKSGDLTIDVPELIREVLAMPQAELDIRHHFGPCSYIREMRTGAGELIIGKLHKQAHVNVFLKGRMLMLNEPGGPRIVEAPLLYVAEPGRKIAVTLEPCVWQNVYATDEKDLDELDKLLYVDESYLTEGACPQQLQP